MLAGPLSIFAVLGCVNAHPREKRNPLRCNPVAWLTIVYYADIWGAWFDPIIVFCGTPTLRILTFFWTASLLAAAPRIDKFSAWVLFAAQQYGHLS
jgi:hypothetical protein